MFECKYWFYFFIALLSFNYIVGENKKPVVCYIAAWAVYRRSQGKFTIDDVDTKLCSHIILAYHGINETTNTIASRDSWGDYLIDGRGLGQIPQLVELKQKTKERLKIMVSIGGWAEGSVKFSNIAASTVKRKTFIDSISEYLKQHQLDGIDISWQFPADRGGIPEDKTNFVSLLKELRERMKTDYKALSVQLVGKRYHIDSGYDIKGISQHVDFINLMVFEYNGPWNKETGLNSPLRSKNDFNVEFAVDYMIKKSVNPKKVMLGIPTYGHCFTMATVPDDGLYLNVESDEGYMPRWSEDRGYIGFNEVCYELATTTGWKEIWDEESSTPYAVNHKKFVSYDNQRSIVEKVKLIKLKSLGGAVVWSLDTDDFKALCKGDKFPLVTTLRDHLNKDTPITISNSTIVSHVYGRR